MSCHTDKARVARELLQQSDPAYNPAEPVTRTLFTTIRTRLEEITREVWETQKLLTDLQTSVYGPKPNVVQPNTDNPPKPCCESDIIDYVISDLRMLVAQNKEIANDLRNIA